MPTRAHLCRFEGVLGERDLAVLLALWSSMGLGRVLLLVHVMVQETAEQLVL